MRSGGQDAEEVRSSEKALAAALTERGNRVDNKAQAQPLSLLTMGLTGC